jgi:hypothetical protein
MATRLRFRTAIIAVCAILVVGLWLAQVNPYLNAADDSGRYMVLGESLAKTGDLRLINDVRRLRDTLYVPGLPALIAAWLKVTGRDPGGVVVAVKATLLVLLLGTLPLFYALLARAGLRRPTIAAAMIAYAACPALVSYANDVMSEMPLLFLCLASIVLATKATEEGSREADRDGGPPLSDPEAEFQNRIACLLGSLICAVLAYYVRAAGAVLLLSLAVWYWRSLGWKWGAATLGVLLLVVGTWQMRTQRIIAEDPPNTPHDTYMKQFTLKNPDDPTAGRIQTNALGIASRIKRCFPPNIANIPRAVLYSVGGNSRLWQGLFVVIAVPFTALVFYGWLLAWRRRMFLVCGFCVLFWIFVALWPWVNPRFLVPLVPYILLFAFIGAEAAIDMAERSLPSAAARAIGGLAMALYLLFYGRVYALVIPYEHKPTVPGYALGRTRAEAGFYAAAAWLRDREPTGIVMARPAYLMHLYSGHPTTQIEPNTAPRVQELAYMEPNHVRFLVFDRWPWAHTENYLGPYLRSYGAMWSLVWLDPRGSGVRVYRRND